MGFLPTMNKLNWVFYSLYMTCIAFLLQVYQALKMYTSLHSVLFSWCTLYSLNIAAGYCIDCMFAIGVLYFHSSQKLNIHSLRLGLNIHTCIYSVNPVALKSFKSWTLKVLNEKLWGRYRQWFLLQQFCYDLQHFQSVYLKFV